MKNIRFLYSGLLLLAASVVFSAPAPPPTGGTTGGPVCWPPPCVPVDSGILFLVVAGALYVAKKFYDYRKKSEVIS